jgi:hypothetical protein
MRRQGLLQLRHRRQGSIVQGRSSSWRAYLAGDVAFPVASRTLAPPRGGSKNKPFCDGTHSTNGFEG